MEGQLVAAMRKLGFDYVFDTNFSADLTIMEEGSEFLDRVQNGGKLPMITSCSSAWMKCLEQFYPDLIENVSTCKSPMSMQGAMTKTYWADKMGFDPKQLRVWNSIAKRTLSAEQLKNQAGPRDDANLTPHEQAKRTYPNSPSLWPKE